MKTKIIGTLSLIGLLGLASCATRTIAYHPLTTHVVTTTTQPVYAGAQPVAATTVRKTIVASAMDADISQNLDLQAVAALFAQSRDLENFERMLNMETEGINNLDMNGDGYVDYLRVVENYENGVHVIVLQAVLAQNIFQDVATLVVERTDSYTYHVQAIGHPYLYGANYIVEPVYYRAPLIYSTIWGISYRPWNSPYHWGYFPTHYKHYKPMPYSAYHPHINTFMHQHAYCHQVTYPSNVHYTNYQRLAQTITRNDYSAQNPQRSFEQRTAGMTTTNSATNTTTAVRNTRDLSNTRGTVNQAAPTTGGATRTPSGSSSTSVSTGNSRATTNNTSTTGSNSRGTSTPANINTNNSGASRTSNNTTTTPATTGNSRGTTTNSGTSRGTATPANATPSNSGASRNSATTTTPVATGNSRGTTTTNSGTSRGTATPAGTATSRGTSRTTTKSTSTITPATRTSSASAAASGSGRSNSGSSTERSASSSSRSSSRR